MSDSPAAYTNYSDFRPTGSSTLKDSYFSLNLDIKATKNLSKDAKIIELGPGTGNFLTRLRNLGYVSLEAFEICDEYRISLRENGFKVYDGDSLEVFLDQIPDGYFDALFAIDVFEHINRFELQSFLHRFRKKLKPGGFIFGQVPNSSGLFGHNTYLSDITHVTPFNEISIESLLLGCGYKNVTVSDNKLPMSFGNLFRICFRFVVYRLAYVVSRLLAATPIRNLSSIILFEARS